MPDYGAFVNESARIDRPVPGTGPNPNYGRFSVNFDQPVESVQPIDPSQDSEDLIISRRAFDYHNATGRQYIDRLHQHEKRSRNPAEQGTIQKLQAQVNKLREEERVLKERLRLSDRKRVHVEHVSSSLIHVTGANGIRHGPTSSAHSSSLLKSVGLVSKRSARDMMLIRRFCTGISYISSYARRRTPHHLGKITETRIPI